MICINLQGENYRHCSSDVPCSVSSIENKLKTVVVSLSERDLMCIYRDTSYECNRVYTITMSKLWSTFMLNIKSLKKEE